MRKGFAFYWSNVLKDCIFLIKGETSVSNQQFVLFIILPMISTVSLVFKVKMLKF